MLGGRGGSTIDFGHAGPVATFAAASLQDDIRASPPQRTTFINNSRSLRQSRQMRPVPGGVTGMAQTMTTGGDVQAQWARVRGRLRDEFGEAAFRSWLKSMTLAEVSDGRVRIGVPTRFLRDWVAAHYADRIRALWSGENAAISVIDIFVSGAAAVPPLRGVRVREEPAIAASGLPAVAVADEKGDISAPLDPRCTFENFVVGKPNELAHAAARPIAESCVAAKRTVPFNPLFLYGGVGLGKTPLMHAIAWHIRTQSPARKAIYLRGEKFSYQ